MGQSPLTHTTFANSTFQNFFCLEAKMIATKIVGLLMLACVALGNPMGKKDGGISTRRSADLEVSHPVTKISNGTSHREAEFPVGCGLGSSNEPSYWARKAVK